MQLTTRVVNLGTIEVPLEVDLDPRKLSNEQIEQLTEELREEMERRAAG